MANALGLGTLAVLVGVLAFFVPASQIPAPMFVFIYALLAVASLYVWNRHELMESPVGCLISIAASVIFGLLFLAADIILGQVHYPDESWLGGAAKVGGPFGLPLTMLVFPGLFSISVAGLVRSFFLEKTAA